MTLKALYKKLESNGLAVSWIKLTEDRDAIKVSHDYVGPYPTNEALAAHSLAFRLALKNGKKAEARGYWQATFIY